MKYIIHLNSGKLVYEQRVHDSLTIEADIYEKDSNFVTFWKDGKIVLDVKISEIYYIKLDGTLSN